MLKISKTSNSDCSNHIEDDIMQNREQKEKVKQSEKPRFYGQNKPFSPWVVLATWLHVRDPQKIQEK
jgi:hypothetical protein